MPSTATVIHKLAPYLVGHDARTVQQETWSKTCFRLFPRR